AVFFAVLCSLLVVAMPAAARTSTTTSTQLFAASSVWNAALPDNAPLDASSLARTGALVGEVNNEEQLRIGPWIDERSNSTPFYVVGKSQPKVPVKLDTTAAAAVTLQNVLNKG